MSSREYAENNRNSDARSWSWEQSGGSSISSEQSKLRKISTFGTTYRWKSIFQFIAIALACTVSVSDLFSFTSAQMISGITIFHYVVTFVFVVLPIYYMYIVLGQYTQLGLVLLKYLNPISRGVTFSFIINMMLKIIKNGILIVDYGTYFVTTLIGDLQWASCPVEYKDKCWSIKSDCKKNCLDEKTKMSAEIYYEQVFLQNPVIDVKDMSIGSVPMTQLVFLFSTWFVFVLMLTSITSSFFRLRKMLLVSSLIITFILLTHMSLVYGKTDNFTKLFQAKKEIFLNLYIWASAVDQCINIMALGRAFHIFHGSYMSPTSPSGLLALAVSAVVFALIAFCSLISTTALEMIVEHAHLDTEHENHVLISDTADLNYVIIPQALSFLNHSKLWTLVYFGSILLLLVANQLSHIVLAEKTISDRFPMLIRYRKYTNSAICIFCALCGIMLMSREAYLLKSAVLFDVDSFLETFNCFVLCFIVCWIYGVQKLSDDIHFLTGSQPPKFWKICWYCMPCITGSVHIYFVYAHYEEDTHTFLIEIILYLIFISPVPIVAFVEIFRYIKNRNLLGIFYSEERFGPPDPQERHFRRVYNPRKETRFRRKRDVCYHNCLLTSKLLKRVTSEEISFKKAYGMHLKYEEMSVAVDEEAEGKYDLYDV